MAYDADLHTDVEADTPEGEAPTMCEWVKQLNEYWILLNLHLDKAFKSQKTQYDKHHTPRTYKVGDKVMLQAKNIHNLHPAQKISDWQHGPFTIIETWGKQAYHLQLTPQYHQIHPVFHVSLLEPYCAQPGEEEAKPGPVIIDGEDEWEVESILTKWGIGWGVQYLVHWQGYPPSEDTWETHNTVEETKALDIFEAEQQKKADQAWKDRNLCQRTWNLSNYLTCTIKGLKLWKRKYMHLTPRKGSRTKKKQEKKSLHPKTKDPCTPKEKNQHP